MTTFPGRQASVDASSELAEARQRWIIHVDMDAFFASVEALDDPRLAGRPLIVGGAGSRGVVASCSYEARVFGVRSAMPSVQARRLCPQAVFVPGRYDRYAELSRQMHAVFHRFTPLVEGISLDEAFLDVTGSIRLFGPPVLIATSIREQIRSELRLNCSVGVAPVKFLAKLASEAAKPRIGGSGSVPASSAPSAGVYSVERGCELEFLHPHPIEALWGVGPATARRLRGLGFVTIGQLAAVDPQVLQRAVGRAHGAHLAALARGVDPRGVEPERPVKSVSHEETYPVDRRDAEGLRVEILRMADGVASRLRAAGLAGRTVTLKVRYSDFSTHTRSLTEPSPTDSARAIAATASRLLETVDLAPGVRLLGVASSNFFRRGPAAAEQLSLDLESPPTPARSAELRSLAADDAGRPQSGPPVAGSSAGSGGEGGESRDPAAVEAAIDAIRRRFGPEAVGPAALIGPTGLRVKRTGDSQWGPGAASTRGPGNGERGPSGDIREQEGG